ncbi:MAG: hypothetical protein K0R24_1673 [Gammaproteobacteria bacterium]|jgi:hypothetical protein|nr:hypothetical protein [Gammaproteobacteria bacterium]
MPCKTRNSVRKKNGIPLVQKREFGQKGYAKKGNPDGLWGMRTAHFTEVVTETGETVALKTDAVINPKKIHLKNSTQLEPLEKNYYKKIRGISSNRRTIITERSINGSPLKGHTPTKKTPMYAHSTYGFVTFLTNKKISSHTRITAEKVDESFFESPEYKSAPEVTESTKKQSFAFYPNTHRSQQPRPSLNATMRISAAKYTRATGLIKEDEEDKENKLPPDEWNHLKPHSLGGNKKKNKKERKIHLISNVVACSRDANSQETRFGSLAKKLAKSFQEIKVDVEASLIPETHVAKHIEYTINHESFSLFGKIENTPVTPHVIEKEYFSCFREALEETLQPNSTP